MISAGDFLGFATATSVMVGQQAVVGFKNLAFRSGKKFRYLGRYLPGI
jgi:hypothetical protein